MKLTLLVKSTFIQSEQLKKADTCTEMIFNKLTSPYEKMEELKRYNKK